MNEKKTEVMVLNTQGSLISRTLYSKARYHRILPKIISPGDLFCMSPRLMVIS